MILRIEPVFTFTLLWLLFFGGLAAYDKAEHHQDVQKEQRA